MLQGEPLLKHALQVLTNTSKGWGAHLNEHTATEPSRKQAAYQLDTKESGLLGPERVPRLLLRQDISCSN